MSPRNRLAPVERFRSFKDNSRFEDLHENVRSHLEQLEPRQLMAAFVVDTLVDENDGVGVNDVSLRDAIVAANGDATIDTITFDAAIAGGTITLGGSELEITEGLIIDASSISGITIDADDSSRVFDITGGKTVVMSNLALTNAYEVGVGGAIRAGASSNLTLSYMTISNSLATFGAGLAAESNSEVTINNSSFEANHAQYRGGAIYSDSGSSVTITDSTISGNTAVQVAGVFAISSSLALAGSTVDNNIGYYGAAVSAYGSASATISNSTISGNSSLSNVFGGAGVLAWDSSDVTLTNSTVTGNSSLTDGGGILNDAGSTVTINNSIVAGNSTNDIYGPGTVVGSNNILSQASLSGFTDGVDGNQLNVSVNTVLNTTLAFNGGFTRTHELLSGGSALDAGDDTLATGAGLTTDQRGQTRFVGTVDIGAYEFSNVAPDDLSIDSGAINENVADNKVVGTVTVSDANPSDTHTFSLTDDAGGRFDIDANTGVVSVEDGSLLDHEVNGSHVVTVEATDSGTLSFSKDLTITISDVNESPDDLSIDSSSVNENAPDDTVVGTVSVSDIDDGDTHTFSLTDDAGGRFDIDANTGVVSVEDGSLLNHETNESHVVTVEATDSGTLSFSKDLTITISDVNESPDDLSIDSSNVNENVPDDTVVGTVSVSDIDDGDTHTFSLTDDAGGRFDIDANTGVVTVEDGSLLDHETDASHVITVQATDSGTLSFSESFTVTISDVNETPTDLAISNDIIGEDIGDNDPVGTVTVTDVDDGDTHTFSLTDTAGGRFSINANTGLVSVVSGALIDFDLNASHKITVQVTDSGGLTFDKELTILVTKVFFAPTDITLSDNEVNEGSANGTVIATASSVDVPLETHTYQLVDDAGGRFAINSTTGEISVLDTSLIDPDVNTSHDITIRSTNGAAESFDKTFTINVVAASGTIRPQRLPHAIQSGETLSGRIRASITNDSGIDFVRSGDLVAKVVAIPLDGGTEITLAERTINGNWRNGQTRNVNLSISNNTLPIDEYQIIVVLCYENTTALEEAELFASQESHGRPFVLNVAAAPFVDLVGRIEIASNADRDIQAGVARATKVRVTVENFGTAVLEGQTIDLQIFAEDPLGSRLADPVGTVNNLRLPRLQPSGSKSVNVNIEFPAGTTPDQYFFVVEVDSSNDVAETNPGGTGESNNDDNITASTVTLSGGVIDLSGSVSDNKGTPEYTTGQAIQDRRRFLIANSGTVGTPRNATADLVLNVYNSLDVLVATQTIESQSLGRLRAGGSRTVRVDLDLAGLTAGNYRVVVDIQPENFTDSTLGNNTFEFFFDVLGGLE